MFLGIDIGGTKVLAVLTDQDGTLHARAKKRVREQAPDRVLARCRKAARACLAQAGVDEDALVRVGLAVPSGVDGGVARFAPNLGWRDVPIARLAEEVFGRPVIAGNDVNLGLAADLAETARREPARSAVGFYLGTGMGGGIIHDGRLVAGARGLAGELGHVVVATGGRRCGCGNRGCLEAYASKRAFRDRIAEATSGGRPSVLAERIRRDGSMLRARELLGAWESGDELVRAVIEDGMRHWGVAVASMVNAFDPDVVVLGGGVIEKFGDRLVGRVRGHAAPDLFGGPDRAAIIRESPLADDAVPLGAALLARREGQFPG